MATRWWNFFEDIFIHFDKMYKRWQTDRQTPHTAHRQRLFIASRGKHWRHCTCFDIYERDRRTDGCTQHNYIGRAKRLHRAAKLLSHSLMSGRCAPMRVLWYGIYSRVYRPTQYIIGHFGDDFTGQMTQPTVSQHWRMMVSQPSRQGPITPGSAH